MTDDVDTSVARSTRAGAVLPGWARATIGTVAFVLLVRAFGIAPYEVHSDSMTPTVTEGSTVLVDKLTPRVVAPGPGDLVVFERPSGTQLKRVVAVAGDRVEILDAVLHVNGDPVTEPYVDPDALDGIYFGPVTVQDDGVFVLGDNRFVSIDSRDYGTVRLDTLVGRVLNP